MAASWDCVSRLSHLRAIGEFVGCEVDFAKGSLSNQTSNRVVANRPEIFGIELAGKGVNTRKIPRWKIPWALTRGVPDTNLRAVPHASSQP